MNKKEEHKEICYNCLLPKYKDQIRDIDKYEEAMTGITVAMLPCDVCGKSEWGIVPEGDIKRAVRASRGEYINFAEWD